MDFSYDAVMTLKIGQKIILNSDLEWGDDEEDDGNDNEDINKDKNDKNIENKYIVDEYKSNILSMSQWAIGSKLINSNRSISIICTLVKRKNFNRFMLPKGVNGLQSVDEFRHFMLRKDSFFSDYVYYPSLM